MATRIITKPGDIFEAKISDTSKRYFQYVTNDLTQLNSEVIRIFNTTYLLDEQISIDRIVQDKILLYAHCDINFGVKLTFWKKIGRHTDVGNWKDIIFRCTSEYARRADEEPIKMSNKWYIWKIGDDRFTDVGKLVGDNRNSYIGLVINPKGIMELLKGNEYPKNYPRFE